jgi:hypothetical protein
LTVLLVYVGILVLHLTGLFCGGGSPFRYALVFLFCRIWRNVWPLLPTKCRACLPPHHAARLVQGARVCHRGRSPLSWHRAQMVIQHECPARALPLAALAAFWAVRSKGRALVAASGLHPVQRLCNRTPLSPSRTHTATHVATKELLRFQPRHSIPGRLHDDDGVTRTTASSAAAMPDRHGVPPYPILSIWLPRSAMYLQFGLYVVSSVGVQRAGYLSAQDPSTRSLRSTAPPGNLYYWFGLPGWLLIRACSASSLVVSPPDPGGHPVMSAEVRRSLRREPLF